MRSQTCTDIPSGPPYLRKSANVRRGVRQRLDSVSSGVFTPLSGRVLKSVVEIVFGEFRKLNPAVGRHRQLEDFCDYIQSPR